MSHRTIIQEGKPEQSTLLLAATFTDEAGDAISSLDSLALTLYDKRTGAIVNSRNAQDVLNANGGTFAAGAFTLQLDPDDTVILGTRPREVHVAMLEFTWASGSKSGKHEIEHTIENLTKVT